VCVCMFESFLALIVHYYFEGGREGGRLFGRINWTATLSSRLDMYIGRRGQYLTDSIFPDFDFNVSIFFF